MLWKTRSGAWLARSVGHATLTSGVVSLSSGLGTELAYIYAYTPCGRHVQSNLVVDTKQTPEKLQTRAVRGQDKILCQLVEGGERVEGWGWLPGLHCKEKPRRTWALVSEPDKLRDWTGKKNPGTNKNYSKVAGYRVNIKVHHFPLY